MSRPGRIRPASLTLDELFARSPWYAALDEPARRQVRADASERAVALGQMLGHHGERQHAWFGVLEGLVKWSITARDGRSVTLGGQSVGSWFGEGTLIRAAPRQSDLIALRHSRVAQIPFETFDWLRRERPSFNEFLLRQVNERLHWFMGSFAAHGLLDSDGLVARAIVGMVLPLSNPLGQLRLQLSQEELANLAAVSRQSCNAALVRFREAGWVDSGYGGLEVLDLEELTRRAT